MKKIFLLCSFIAVTLFFTSCNKKNEGNDKIDNYDDYIVEIDSKTKVDIEEAYYNKYGYEMKWCNPKEVDGFESIDELENYRNNSVGVRIYGKINNQYILCDFSHTFGYIVHTLRFNDKYLISENKFLPGYGRTIIYSDGVIIFCDGDFDLSTISSIDESDSLKIKDAHDSFNYHYCGALLNEDEKQNNDYNSAYNRIYKELTLA